MEATARPSTGPLIAVMLVGAFALFVWLIVLSWLTTLNYSDAAGNGMSQGFAALGLIFLWILLAVVMLIGALGGNMPSWTALAAVALIPASGYAAQDALSVLAHGQESSAVWPLAQPALTPPLIIALCLWAVMPPLRRAVPAWLAGGAVWGVVFVLSVAVIAAE